MADEPKMIRVRLDGPLLTVWESLTRSHKITQQDALTAVISWLAEQDAITRSMIFGQVPDADRADLSRLVLRRMAASGKPAKTKGSR